MSISCLTITQPGRLDLLRRAVGDFARQRQVGSRELIVVHDGDQAFAAQLAQLAALYPQEVIRCHAAPPGLTLGELRNIAIDLAGGEFVCQWDDDDRHHPQRLARQHAALLAERADCNFLTEQLHWLADRDELYWTDWSREAYPLDFIQGSLFARRGCLPRYLALRRGEDTALCLELLRGGAAISRLRGVAWLYVYVFHGGNVFAQAHHEAIVVSKALQGAHLLARLRELQTHLGEFDPPLGRLTLPSRSGALHVG